MPIQHNGREYVHTLSLNRRDAINFALSIFPGEDLNRILSFDEERRLVFLHLPDDSTILATYSLRDDEEDSVLTLYPLQ